MNSILNKLLSGFGVYNKLLSGIGFIFIIFVISFIAGYRIKANSVNLATAKQDIKLATLQSKYDELANLAQQQYFIGEEQINESNPNFYNSNKHDFLWSVFKFNHITNTLCQDYTTKFLDAKTKTSLENGRENTLQLKYLQQYIIGIQKLQNE